MTAEEVFCGLYDKYGKALTWHMIPLSQSNGALVEELKKKSEIIISCIIVRYGQWQSANGMGALHMDYPFYDAPNTAAIVCCHIIDDGKPVLYVSHDEDDGMWQFLCGSTHETDEARLVSLKSVFDLDNSVGELSDMPCGYCAERKTKNDHWIMKKR